MSDQVRPIPHKIVRSRMSVRDLAGEAIAGMLARPGRTFLTVLGTVLGVAALVATLGLAKTAGNQIVTRFDALAATSVSVSNRTEGFFRSPGPGDTSVIPWDAEDRLTRLNGVVAAGTLTLVDTAGDLVSAVPVNDPLGQSEFAIDVHRRNALDEVELRIEVRSGDAREVTDAVGRAIRNATGLRVPVSAVDPGGLPHFDLKAKRFHDHRDLDA